MKFSSDDQQVFSRISGDSNPIHLDTSWAERVFPGAIVVFGVFVVLTVLEALKFSTPICGLKVKFIKPIYQDEQISFSFLEKDSEIEIQVFIGKDVAIKIQLMQHALARIRNIDISYTGLAAEACQAEELTFLQIQNASGSVKVPGSDNSIRSLFPNCSRQLGLNTVQGLLALSQIVGMRCPGRRGLFSGFELRIRNKSVRKPYLSYKCVYANKSLGFSRLVVLGYGIEGLVEAYFTLPKDKLVKIYPESTTRQYSESNALIIGGSGLGHTCALLLANGGAKVCVTSRSKPIKGTPTFDLLEKYINVSSRILDVTDSASVHEFTSNVCGEIRSIYYFPTPRIFRRRLRILSETDTFDFLNYYVFSFVRLIETLYMSNKCSKDVSIFYPSSIAVEDANPNQFEYYISKLAGEEACTLLKKKYPRINLIVVRLPRLETDQTNSFIQISSSDNLSCLAEIVEKTEARSNCA